MTESLNEALYDSLEDFIKNMKSINVLSMSFSEIDEQRPVVIDRDVLEVRRQTRVDIIAYKKPVLHKCVIQGADLETIHKKLCDEGFEVTRRSRNIL